MSNNSQRPWRIPYGVADFIKPVTLDDVTSGFNIGNNISLQPEFNALLGFTHAELATLFADLGQDIASHRALIDEWYNRIDLKVGH